MEVRCVLRNAFLGGKGRGFYRGGGLILLFVILSLGIGRGIWASQESPVIIYYDEEENAQFGKKESQDSLQTGAQVPSGNVTGIEEVVVIDPASPQSGDSREQTEEIYEPWNPLYLSGEGEGSLEGSNESGDSQEEVIVIGEEPSSLKSFEQAPLETSRFGELVDLKGYTLEENLSDRRLYHDRLFAMDKGAPLLLGEAYAVADVRLKESEEIVRAGEKVTVYDTVDYVSITDRGTLNSGALAPSWEGSWWKQLYTDSIYSTRFIGLVYSYGLRIPSSLRGILSEYSVTLRNVFLDRDLLSCQGVDSRSDGLTGQTLGFVTVTPQDEHLLYLACIPEYMEWVFFHEFGHTLDIQYFYHNGRFLSEEPEFSSLLQAELSSFEEHLPLVSEHNDHISELLAEIVASYFCRPDLLGRYCPRMYAFVDGLMRSNQQDWTPILPASETPIFYGCWMNQE